MIVIKSFSRQSVNELSKEINRIIVDRYDNTALCFAPDEMRRDIDEQVETVCKAFPRCKKFFTEIHYSSFYKGDFQIAITNGRNDCLVIRAQIVNRIGYIDEKKDSIEFADKGWSVIRLRNTDEDVEA